MKNGVLVRISPLAPLFPLPFALKRAAGCTDTRTEHCRPDHASLLLRVPQVLVDGLLLPPALLLLLTGYRAPPFLRRLKWWHALGKTTKRTGTSPRAAGQHAQSPAVRGLGYRLTGSFEAPRFTQSERGV